MRYMPCDLCFDGSVPGCVLPSCLSALFGYHDALSHVHVVSVLNLVVDDNITVEFEQMTT